MDVLYSGRNFAKHISGPAPEKQNKMERENSVNC